MKLSIVSGGFDPVHVGHIDCFEKARAMADVLFVIVNNDKFLNAKEARHKFSSLIKNYANKWVNAPFKNKKAKMWMKTMLKMKKAGLVK